jgi:two-component system, NtrC family, sensor kinase
MLAVPMLRDGDPIGAIVVNRGQPGSFSEKHIELLKTFADQAVIAIENVRLFTELQQKNEALTQAHAQVTEALDQQTATSEILKVIASSPTDVQPVFDAIARNAARLCSANDAQVLRVEGETLRLVAAFGVPSMPSVRQLTRGHLVGRAVIERRTIHIRDWSAAEVLAEYPESTRRYGVQSALAVPLLRDGVALGVIRISRTEIRPFTDKQIALVKTFADQAVIAIENVRLFKELEARTHDLTRSVGELRALGEVGQAISSTLDLQAVLSTIVARATELSGTDAGVVYEYDKDREVFLPRATEHLEAEIVETMLATPVRKGKE